MNNQKANRTTTSFASNIFFAKTIYHTFQFGRIPKIRRIRWIGKQCNIASTTPTLAM